MIRLNLGRRMHSCIAALAGVGEHAIEHALDGCAGHAYAAAISACAAGSQWPRAVELFDEMLELGIKPDVVSCTALISALGADAQWERAERVVSWMLKVHTTMKAFVLCSQPVCLSCTCVARS